MADGPLHCSRRRKGPVAEELVHIVEEEAAESGQQVRIVASQRCGVGVNNPGTSLSLLK